MRKLGAAVAGALLLMSTLAFSTLTSSASTQGVIEQSGTSLFGDIKYKPGFKQFDYVNAQAPKGGELRLSDIGTFDSFNAFIVTGVPPSSIGLIYDTLMTSSYDEPSSQYGLVASSVSYPDDFSSATYMLRPEARFQDGTRITPEDVIWSMETLRKLNPFYAAYYANIAKVEKLGPEQVRFDFAVKGNRELPQIVGQLTVLPKYYWLGKDANGKPRDITKTTLEPPLGSGPYKIASFAPGRSVVYARVKDYWGAQLPVHIGTNNFDSIRYDYYRDETVALQAFLAGRFDQWTETSAKNWATAYNTAAVKDGRIRREQIVTHNPRGMQAFAFNLRRAKFQDSRVRAAFNWALDFEWQNKNIFFGQYRRLDSYFANSELATTGVPQGLELAMLQPYVQQLPPALFTTPYSNPKTDGTGDDRANLREAMELLHEAGWAIENGVLTNNKTGEAMNVEFLLDSDRFERVVAPYKQSLAKLGIQVTTRIVDTAQYQNRLDNRDFDIVVGSWGQSLSPGNEQREFWGCASEKRPGSRNISGICDPVVESMINHVIFAKSRTELVAATHALDRVLLWRHYVVPQWYLPYERNAYWARLKHPVHLPDYSDGFPELWWSADGAPAHAANP